MYYIYIYIYIYIYMANSPITAAAVVTAFVKLNNNSAYGYDSIPGELLKYAPAELSTLIADTFNNIFEKHQQLNIGTGVLIALQKPSKPFGPLSRDTQLIPAGRIYLDTLHSSNLWTLGEVPMVISIELCQYL